MDSSDDVGFNYIEGYPFIIRFKTQNRYKSHLRFHLYIEGYPFIIRFKTLIAPSLSIIINSSY